MTFMKLRKASQLSKAILAGNGSESDKIELRELSKTVREVQARQPEKGINELLLRVEKALAK
jgi:hypothetical protein